MNSLKRLFFSLRKRIFSRSADEALDEEIQFHIDMSIEQKMAGGMDRKSAEKEAKREFGKTIIIREAVRMSWGAQFLDELLNDLKFGIRRLVSRPFYTVSNIIMLGLSMAVCAWFFGSFYRLHFQITNAPRAGEMVELFSLVEYETGSFMLPVSKHLYNEIRALNDSFSAIAFVSEKGHYVSYDDIVERHWIPRVTPSYWNVVDVPVAFGRVFSDKENRDHNGNLVVLSHRFATKVFGQASAAVGETLRIDDTFFEIIGVLPEKLNLKKTGDIIIPLNFDEILASSPNDFWNERGNIVARLDGPIKKSDLQYLASKSDQIIESVAEKNANIRQLVEDHNLKIVAKRYNQNNRSTGNLLDPASITRAVFLLGVSLYLISCLNTASLTVAHLLKTRHEILMSIAIGGRLNRLFRQHWIQNALLFVVSALLGFFLLQWFPTVMQGGVVWSKLRSQSIWLLFILMFMGLLINGFILYIRIARSKLQAGLKNYQPTSSPKSLALKILTATQIALAVILVLFSTFLSINIIRLLGKDPGFNYEGRTIVFCEFPAWKFEQNIEAKSKLVYEINDFLGALPGVMNVSPATALPQTSSQWSSRWSFNARDVFPENKNMDPERRVSFGSRGVLPDFFPAMDIEILLGRNLRPEDRYTPTIEYIVEKRLVDLYLPDQNPIGYSFSVNGTTFQIVGVCNNLSYSGAYASRQPEDNQNFESFSWYEEGPKNWTPQVDFVIKSTNLGIDYDRIVKGIRALDPDIWIKAASYDEDFISRYQYLIDTRNSIIFLSGFTILLGLFGVFTFLNYQTLLQTREISIKKSLGAKPSLLIWQYIRKNLLPVIIGFGVAIPITLLLLSQIREKLTEIDFYDPVPYAIAVVILVAITTISVAIPLKRVLSMPLRETLIAE